MPSLADIGPLSKTVPIRGVQLTVRGVNVHDIFGLLEQFPALKQVISQRAVNGDVALAIVEGIPAAIGSIIACGCGESDNAASIASAQSLAVGEQMEILEAIADMTFPRGVRSFMNSLVRLIDQAKGGRGWAQDTNSPAPSKNASVPGTDQQKSGGTPPDSLQDGVPLSTGNASAEI